MSTAANLRAEIEAALAHRIPSALTPVKRIFRPVAATGIGTLDQVLEGGLPVAAITEIVGPQSSGRTALVFSFLASGVPDDLYQWIVSVAQLPVWINNRRRGRGEVESA